MSTKIFVNLPVKDLEKSKAFFSALGYTFNAQFTDENAACLVISEDIYAMLLLPEFFKRFTTKEIVDGTKSTEVIIALSAESREAVDELAKRAIGAGGKQTRDVEDYGWMYGRSFEDLDGHQWETMWMDESKREPVVAG
jgi:predicted lactoylglutathione lyase